MTLRILTGGCLCGAVRYETTGEPTLLCCCHCESCRKAAGAPMVPWGTYRTTQFVVTRGRIAEFRSSPPVTRGHCADCGTSLTYRHETRPGEIDVTLASFDDAAALAPTAHIWVQDKLPWVTLADGLPQFATTLPANP
jgi:hypothetical protein